MADPAAPANLADATPSVAASPARARPRRSQRPAVAAHRRFHLGLLLAALAVALGSWPLLSLEPGVGLDPSWRTGLHMAAHQGLDAGTEVLFSFGPLGFLRAPQLAFPWTTRLSFAYTLAIQFLLCLALVWALRRSFGSLLVAAALALVAATLIVQEPVPVIVFAVALAIVHGERAGGPPPWLLGGVGALVGIQMLAKLNTALAVAAICVIAILALRERRRVALAWFAGGVGLALAAGWALSGQPLGAIGPYVSGSLDVVGGYSEAMGYEDPGRMWELWAALALTAAGLAIIVRADGLRDERVRFATAAMWLVLAFASFKSGFVRHDVGHANIFFATLLGGLAVLPLERVARATAALVLVLAATALFGSLRADPAQLVAPLERAGAFFEQAGTLADGTKLNAAIVAARARVGQSYGLDPRSHAALRGHPAHVEPTELAVLWAFQLPWRPVPMFQSYTAYAEDLDRRNAAAYASPSGPERVLRRDQPAVDARNPAWESPAAMRALLCNFRAVVTSPPWQVLARTPNRCAPPRLLATLRTRFGVPIPVPRAPGRRSVVHVELDGVQPRGFERVATLAYRAGVRFAALGDRAFRLVPGTARDGLVMRVPAAVDFRAPFALHQGADSIVITRGDEPTDDAITARFYATDVRRWTTAPRRSAAPRG